MSIDAAASAAILLQECFEPSTRTVCPEWRAKPEIARRLVTGEKVVLQEFGTFTVESAKARARFDFAAGAPVKKPERFFVKFTPCKELASEVQRAHLKRAKNR
jgi:nucleoid DNA-binding protein